MEHGDGINLLLDECQEELVVLLEDDCYIWKAGKIKECFEAIESGQYDVIGSPRGSCSKDIWDLAKDKWHLDYSHIGDNGPNFWPNLLFTKKSILLATDRKFGARTWKVGETIEPLGKYAPQDDIAVGDTFVNTSLQLRNMVPKDRIREIPQYHGSTDDQADYEKGANLFDGNAPWVHVGSLSSGVHGNLRDDQGRALGRRKIDPPKDTSMGNFPETDQEKMEWERRVAFWSMFMDYYMLGNAPDPIYEFREEYIKAVNRIIEAYQLNRNRIAKRIALYRTIGL
jgi:hypothetical protein